VERPQHDGWILLSENADEVTAVPGSNHNIKVSGLIGADDAPDAPFVPGDLKTRARPSRDGESDKRGSYPCAVGWRQNRNELGAVPIIRGEPWDKPAQETTQDNRRRKKLYPHYEISFWHVIWNSSTAGIAAVPT
jgi:hypothetical protein